MDTQKEKRNKLVNKYFISTPEKPDYLWNYIAIIGSGLLLIIGYYQVLVGEIPGALLSIIGFVLLIIFFVKYLAKKNSYRKAYNRAEPKASDEQMDKWLAEGIDIVAKEAMNRLDIDSDDTSAYPLMIDGPADDSFIGPGKDRLLRFDRHNILLIFLTEHNVATFQCILDLGLGEILEDRTKEFPYKDITNLETETSNDSFHYRNNEKQLVKGIQQLSLFTSGGNAISVNYVFSKNISDNEDYKFPPSDAENTIKAIRKRLKEYKDKFNNVNG